MKTAVKQRLPASQTPPNNIPFPVRRQQRAWWRTGFGMGFAMQAHLQQWLAGLLTLSFGGILLLLPVHAFFSTWLGTAIGPLLLWKSWKEILLLLLLPLVVLVCVGRPRIAKVIWARRINQLIVLYVLLHAVLAFVSHVALAAMAAGLLMNLRFLAMFVLAQVLVEVNHPWIRKIISLIPRGLLWIAVGLGCLAILQVTIVPKDFLSYFGYNKDSTIAPYIVVDQNPMALRAFATMRGPNTLAAYLVLPLVLAVCFIFMRRDLWLSVAVLALGGIAFFATGSRSAWLGLAFGLLALAIMAVPQTRLVRWVKWSIIPVLLIGAVLGWAALTVAPVRLAVFHSRADRPSLFTGSSQKHVEAIIDNAADALRHPLGQGPGAAGPASFYNPAGAKISENYFIQIAQEVGLVGLGLFVSINLLIARQFYRHRTGLMPKILLASLAGLTIVNLFLHGWADDPTAMTWWGIAGLYWGKGDSEIDE